MKTTKKRLVLGIAGAALLCVGAVFTTLAATAEAPITDETMLANIEALSSDEMSHNRQAYGGFYADEKTAGAAWKLRYGTPCTYTYLISYSASGTCWF